MCKSQLKPSQELELVMRLNLVPRVWGQRVARGHTGLCFSSSAPQASGAPRQRTCGLTPLCARVWRELCCYSEQEQVGAVTTGGVVWRCVVFVHGLELHWALGTHRPLLFSVHLVSFLFVNKCFLGPFPHNSQCKFNREFQKTGNARFLGT